MRRLFRQIKEYVKIVALYAALAAAILVIAAFALAIPLAALKFVFS